MQAPNARRAGVSEEAITAIRDRSLGGLSEEQADIVSYAQQVVNGSRVDQATFDRLHARHGPRWLVELTATAGHFGLISGINNAFRLSGVAVGVAALGAVLERRAASSLSSTLGPHGRALAEAVSSTGLRAAGGRSAIVHAAAVAFVSGLNAVLLIGCVVVAAGALAAGALMRTPAPLAARAPE